ncbi:penicillin-binding transpeptidase domain-containing protein [Paratissierella segnis]|uniref:PASTA domain-containing protein n=1 Tax=Paratissierella segnis TaxID=2763679 RepID=A0A926EXV5_9FIRM|nr:penicillin-binding transpeptidase domain-containing protein [Paratissierella segnis]MBC8588502.1 PASTA domain-containing protein [Paratissierella segnis]
MQTPSKSTKNRLRFVLGGIIFVGLLLAVRLVQLQIFKSEELKKGALEQWTRAIDIKSQRGIIYDRKGKKLAVSVTAYTVWATPAEIKEPKDTAKQIASVLDMDEELVYEKITKNVSTEKIKQWVTKEEATELRKLNIRGVAVVDDNKRYYPYGNFAAYILGFTDIDNNGLYGVEKTYNKYLTGIPGKWVKTTDAANRQLPYDGEKIYDATDGYSIVLTIDETIQHFAEKAAYQAYLENKAKNVSIIVMEPFSGDVLALANKNDYDPNNPREPLDKNVKEEWEKLSQEELQKKWFEMWRNFAINDIYEPGSTFKMVVAAAALEENPDIINSHYYCNGSVRDIKGVVLNCTSKHGSQTFSEAIHNSCNVALVNIGRQLGKEKLLEYIKAFGFGENSGIDLNGEQKGIVPSGPETIKEVNLATMSYGHGIAVTPIQIINSLSTISNGGNLLKPRLVKEIIDSEGNSIKSFESEVRRKVISEQTSKTMLNILRGVVEEGSGKRAYIPGYRVGGKTGTAQKIIDGRYAPGKYIASFAAVAPTDDPKIVVLVVIDEPSGSYYGGTIAGPVIKSVMEDTLNYLEVEPIYDKKDEEEIEKKITVPDVRNKPIGEGGKELADLGLKYITEYQEISADSIIVDQFPLPGVEVIKGSIIDLYLNKRTQIERLMPDLIGKTNEGVVSILDDLGIQYELKGNGKAIRQEPEPGVQINEDVKIFVEFSSQ